MYNRRYDKVFLMLRQETAGYGMGQRTPWGSCVMEIKNSGGRLTLTVQGLRPLRRGEYTVYALVGESAETEGFFCGIVQPDSNGNGEMKWDFNPDGLPGTEWKAEDLHTVAVLTEEGGVTSVPMSASFGEKKVWRKDFIRRNHTKERVVAPKREQRLIVSEAVEETEKKKMPIEAVAERAEETVLVAAEAALAEPTVVLAETTVASEEESYHGSFRGLLAKFQRELADLQDSGVFGEEDMKEIAEAGTGKPKMQDDAKADLEVEEKAEPLVVADPLFQGNAEIQPFGVDGGTWKCISLEEMVLLGGAPLEWQKDCFFLLPLKKYHHLIYRRGDAGYALGVPGMFTAEDGEKAKEMGFDTYRPMEEGELGYWIWEKK